MTTLAPLERLYRRVLLMVGRGRITTGTDAGYAQKHQVRLGADELRDQTIRIAEYGFTSMPLPGANAVVLFVAGDRSNGVIVATDDPRYRIKVEPGETALYTDEGDVVHLKRGRIVEVVAGTKLRVVSPRLEVTGDIVDRCDDQARTIDDMRRIYDEHTHSDPQGGSVSIPTEQMGHLGP